MVLADSQAGRPEAVKESRLTIAARKACMAVPEGTGTPERARAAFLTTADEAGVQVVPSG